MSYIHPDAHASYVHWWKRQIDTYALWFAYRHLNPTEYIPRWKYTRNWKRPWSISRSGESRFVQNGFSKKEKNQVRADWRERKGFVKDHRHVTRRGCPRWIKRQCNKDYRQWQRRLMEAERFEELGTKLRKDYFDPWMWD